MRQLPFVGPTSASITSAVIACAAVLALATNLWLASSRSPFSTHGETFIGRVMPCGHVYQGRSEVVNGTRWFICERGDRWPQQNDGGLYDAR